MMPKDHLLMLNKLSFDKKEEEKVLRVYLLISCLLNREMKVGFTMTDNKLQTTQNSFGSQQRRITLKQILNFNSC